MGDKTDELPEKEVEKRFEETLRRMLATPPELKKDGVDRERGRKRKPRND